MSDAFNYVSLGDRYAVIRQRPGECWKALYYVFTEPEAVEFVGLCMARTKQGAEIAASLAAGMSVAAIVKTAMNYRPSAGRKPKRR